MSAIADMDTANRHMIPLIGHDVHVWRLDAHGWRGVDLAGMRAMLSNEENARADRFLFERDRTRFLRVHAAVRCVLADYLGCEADALQFATNAHGKPYLVKSPSSGTLCFNLSHAEDAAVLALTRNRDIGVDIEIRHLPKDYMSVAKDVFSTTEFEAFCALSIGQHADAFFCTWTRKEAVLKALGVGLSVEPALINTGLAATPREVPVQCDATPRTIFVTTLAARDNAIISVAATQKIDRLLPFSFDAPNRLAAYQQITRTPLGEANRGQMPQEARQC